MVRYCAAANCSNNSYTKGVSLHGFPNASTDLSRRIKWENFIRQKRKNFPHATLFSFICSDHFVREDFTNIMAVEMGFENKRLLNPQSIPSKHKDICSIKAKVAKQCSPTSSTTTTTTTSEPIDRRKKSIIKRNLRKEISVSFQEYDGNLFNLGSRSTYFNFKVYILVGLAYKKKRI